MRRVRKPALGPRLGKRLRRAKIRLRHAALRQAFTRWAFRTNNLPPPELEARPWRTSEWHQWHALGCP
jgi:hypothetical protein